MNKKVYPINRQQTIVNNIMKLMKKNRISQKQYAETNSISESTISAWKKNYAITLDQVIEAAEYFKVSIEEIYYTEEELKNLDFKKQNPDHIHVFAQKIEKIIPFTTQIRDVKISNLAFLITSIIVSILCLFLINNQYIQKLCLIALVGFSVYYAIKPFKEKDYIINYCDEIVFQIDNEINNNFKLGKIMRLVKIILSILLIIFISFNYQNNNEKITFELAMLFILLIVFILVDLYGFIIDKKQLKKKIYFNEIGIYKNINCSFLLSSLLAYFIVLYFINLSTIIYSIILLIILACSMINFYVYSKKFNEYKMYYIDEEKKYNKLSNS